MLTVVADTEKEIVITGDMNFDLKQSNKSAYVAVNSVDIW